DDLEAAHGLGRGGAFDVGAALVVFALGFGVALDGLEEVGVQRAVGPVGVPVPRVDEALRGDRLTVVERPAVGDGDGPVDVVFGLDRLGDLVVRLGGLGVVANEPGEELVENVPAACLVRHAGDERVLRVAAANGDRATAAAGLAAAVVTAVVTAARAQRERQRGGPNDRRL